MSDVTKYVGGKIRRSRKDKGLSIDEFAGLIGKSKATVSKYENGSISIDIETMLKIAEVLDMEMKSLLDYKSPNAKPKVVSGNSYFNQPHYYIYNYDGRTKRVIRSFLEIDAPDDNAATKIDAKLYMGLSEFADRDKAEHIFEGTLTPYDTITHVNLVNQINTTENLYLCILNPMHAHSPAVGVLAGIASSPFFAPIALKIIVAKAPLVEDPLFRSVLEMNREDARNLRNYNMMVINRPSSLHLTEK